MTKQDAVFVVDESNIDRVWFDLDDVVFPKMTIKAKDKSVTREARLVYTGYIGEVMREHSKRNVRTRILQDKPRREGLVDVPDPFVVDMNDVPVEGRKGLKKDPMRAAESSARRLLAERADKEHAAREMLAKLGLTNPTPQQLQNVVKTLS